MLVSVPSYAAITSTVTTLQTDMTAFYARRHSVLWLSMCASVIGLLICYKLLVDISSDLQL